VPEYRAWIDSQDLTPAYRWLRRMLQLLQWQKRRRGEPLRPFVLKTPSHLGYLDVLLAEFPDAHVVHAHRDPVDVITSGASLNATLWRMHCDDVDPHEVGRQWLERMGWACDRALASRPRIDPDRITDVRFTEAVADPTGTVERILADVGLPATGESAAELRAWLDRDRRREALPVHRYRPADFGLTPEGISARFEAYSDAFLHPTG
jgi:hypothetical protein